MKILLLVFGLACVIVIGLATILIDIFRWHINWDAWTDSGSEL
jgi:hypothetical protein